MFGSNPWILLLWIVALAMVLIPLIVTLWISLLNAYYRAKEGHIGRLLKALEKTINSVVDDLRSKKKNTESDKV